MIERMKNMLRHKDSCVLATTDGETPHCSLMAYVADADGEHLYLVTPRNTMKYRNLRKHPRVSLLVDTRGDQERGMTQALTITGTCRVLTRDDDVSQIKSLFCGRHPHLEKLLERDDIEVVCVQAETFQLLDGPETSYYEILAPGT